MDAKTDAEITTTTTTTSTTTTLAAISPTASAAVTTKEIVTTLPVTNRTPVIISTTEADTTTASTDQGGTDLSIVALAGGIVGGLVVVIVIVVVIIVVVRKRRSGKDELSDDDDDDDDDDTPPRPLPKLDEHGRVVRDPDDVISHPPPATPHSPGVYEDPNQPSTVTQIRDKRGSESHHYGNIPVKNDSSVGAYIVPLDHRPVESPPTSPTYRNGDLQSKGFKMDAENSNGHGEEMYIPMDLSTSTQHDAESRDGGSVYVASDLPKPSPCTMKKQHRYANVPCGEPLSGQNGGYKNYPEEDAHHYGNVSMPDGAGGSASFSSAPEAAASHDASNPAQAGWIPLPKLPANQQSKPSPRPGLKVAPKPSPKPSPKQVREALVNSSPKRSPKPLHVEPPTPSPKPSPSAKLSLLAGAVAVPSSVHRLESDSDSEGENYENLKGPKEDYVNAPEKNRDYVNAPKKKISQ